MDAVDDNVVAPIADWIANSALNPYVLSCLLWERSKSFAPGRARDFLRIASTVVVNALKVYNNESTAALRSKSSVLQTKLLQALVAEEGRIMIKDSISVMYKVLLALDTPEVRAAIEQIFETAKHGAQFFATPQGREILDISLDCCKEFADVASSADVAIMLAEVATNICFALEAEEIRKSTEQERDTVDHDRSEECGAKEIEFDKESVTEVSKLPSRAERSARIERDVLLKMGAEPSMFAEISRILEKERATADDDQIPLTDGDSTEEAEQSIASAFGIKVSETELSQIPTSFDPMIVQKLQEQDDENKLLPQWHEDAFRFALQQMCLRRRVQAVATSEKRIGNACTSPSEISRRTFVTKTDKDIQPKFGPADLAACRLLSKFIVYGFVLLLAICSIPVYKELSRILHGYVLFH